MTDICSLLVTVHMHLEQGAFATPVFADVIAALVSPLSDWD